MDDHEFEMFLKGRGVPDAPSNLSHRIIEQAKVASQAKLRVGVLDRLKGLIPDLVMPQPALALGLFLLLAVGVGVFGTEFFDMAQQTEEIGDVYLAFYVDDLLGAGDYL